MISKLTPGGDIGDNIKLTFGGGLELLRLLLLLPLPRLEEPTEQYYIDIMYSRYIIYTII